jgi:hypothetical protein
VNRLDRPEAVEASIQAFYRPLLDQGLEAVRAAFHARGLERGDGTSGEERLAA